MKVKELIFKLKKLNRNAIVCHAYSGMACSITEEIDTLSTNSKGDLVVLWNDCGEGFEQEIKGLKK